MDMKLAMKTNIGIPINSIKAPIVPKAPNPDNSGTEAVVLVAARAAPCRPTAKSGATISITMNVSRV